MLHILTFVAGILITIFFVIGIHEYAHFMAARALGIKVLKFSIGFGKSIFKWHDKKGTEYVLALIPLGGYVKMLDEREETVPENELHLAYNNQAFYKKFLVIVAGPLSNFLSAIVLYWLIFMIGFNTLVPIIGNVTPESIAAKSGLMPNQEIIRVDDRTALGWTSVIMHALTHLGNQDLLKIETKNTTHWLAMGDFKLNELKPDPLISLGITPLEPDIKPGQAFPKALLRKIQYDPLPALSHAWQETVDFTTFNLLFFGKLLTGKMSLQSLGGPISIFETAGVALNTGLIPFLAFLAFFSASIGVINLLPIPGLDGGHLAIQFIEWVIRRPIPERLIAVLYQIGFIFLIFILVKALTNDLLRLS